MAEPAILALDDAGAVAVLLPGRARWDIYGVGDDTTITGAANGVETTPSIAFSPNTPLTGH